MTSLFVCIALLCFSQASAANAPTVPVHQLSAFTLQLEMDDIEVESFTDEAQITFTNVDRLPKSTYRCKLMVLGSDMTFVAEPKSTSIGAFQKQTWFLRNGRYGERYTDVVPDQRWSDPRLRANYAEDGIDPVKRSIIRFDRMMLELACLPNAETIQSDVAYPLEALCDYQGTIRFQLQSGALSQAEGVINTKSAQVHTKLAIKYTGSQELSTLKVPREALWIRTTVRKPHDMPPSETLVSARRYRILAIDVGNSASTDALEQVPPNSYHVDRGKKEYSYVNRHGQKEFTKRLASSAAAIAYDTSSFYFWLILVHGILFALAVFLFYRGWQLRGWRRQAT